MPLRLFTIGYQGRTLPELIDILECAGVQLVIDVRELPWSRKPGFSRKPLEAGLAEQGLSYVHARFAGNPKALRRAARTHDDALARFERHLAGHPEIVTALTQLFADQPRSRRAICLLCYERHPADCHRLTLIQHWRQSTEEWKTPVDHLAPDGAPRFTARTIAPAAAATDSAAGTTSRRSRMSVGG